MLVRHKHLLLVLQLICVGSLAGGAPSGAGAIKHVITLMMENHSFNNLLGWLPGIGDVQPSDYNLLNSSDPNSPKLFASDGAPFCAMADLLHDFADVTEQVFGGASTAANMGGFVHNYAAHGGTAAVPMACFTPQQLPVISALCSSFTCATHFHSSIPGPTGPNRMMLHAATTTGYDGGQFDAGPYHMHARTIYEDLQDGGFTWRIHWQDFTTAHAITPLSSSPNTSALITRDVAFAQFFDALEHGTLPSYTLLVPALGPLSTSSGVQAPNSQHPAYDVRHGEDLMKQVSINHAGAHLGSLRPAATHSPLPQVYDSLRRSSHWNDTLLVLTYDEHGGFWDRQPPPAHVANPCPTCTPSPYAFEFDRLGVRVPTVFISKYSPRRPDPTLYETASIPATIREIFGLKAPPLSPRAAAASTFTSSLSDARDDAPVSLPAACWDCAPPCYPPAPLLTGLGSDMALMCVCHSLQHDRSH